MKEGCQETAVVYRSEIGVESKAALAVCVAAAAILTVMFFKNMLSGVTLFLILIAP